MRMPTVVRDRAAQSGDAEVALSCDATGGFRYAARSLKGGGQIAICPCVLHSGLRLSVIRGPYPLTTNHRQNVLHRGIRCRIPRRNAP
jgi:hypothetical protein